LKRVIIKNKKEMEKISTLYKKDPSDLGRVINEIAPENSWVIEGMGIPTRKFDGTATAIINQELYKRYDCKINRKTGKRKPIPAGAIPCQEPDQITGHHPHWIKCDGNNPADKWHIIAFNAGTFEDGTYELCGEKVQSNPEKIKGHQLIKHGCEVLPIGEYDFDTIRKYLEITDIEGIVFHHKRDGRMCKIRKCDFGIERV
jgi:hypothetical protein